MLRSYAPPPPMSLPCPRYTTKGHVHSRPRRNCFSKVDTIEINSGRGGKVDAHRGVASVSVLTSHSRCIQLLPNHQKLNLPEDGFIEVLFTLQPPIKTVRKQTISVSARCPHEAS